MNEFLQLLRYPGHWLFEIFLMLLFDGLIGAILYPFAKRHWAHHLARDQKDWLAEAAKSVPPCPRLKQPTLTWWRDIYGEYHCSCGWSLSALRI